MKQLLSINKIFFLVLMSFAITNVLVAQDSVVSIPTIKVKYFVKNNGLQYLIVQSRIKEGRKFIPLPKQAVEVYLDSVDNTDLIAKVITNQSGDAACTFSPSLKDKWNSSSKHSFIAVMKGEKGEEEDTSTIEITKTKIFIDTVYADGTRSINVKVMYENNNEWLPAKEVDLKIGIGRDGVVLPAGDEATYTTDSAGVATVELKKLNLPGDVDGNYMLVAKVEDNDVYGNLMIEKSVPWGVATKIDNSFFDQRTLWTTRFRTPFWLLFMAYALVIGVWGTLIYLVMQIVRIHKLGKAAA